MQPYRDRSHDSGVAAYELEDDSIAVRFKTGDTYVYTYASAGRTHIEAMKKLAIGGEGLATYISQHVGKAYASKRS